VSIIILNLRITRREHGRGDEKMAKPLSQLRNEKGKTQRQIAEDMNVGVSTIAMYETGSRMPSLIMARKLAEYFGIKIEDIIFFKNSAHDT